MGFVSYLPVSRFLRSRFRTLGDGGYAGLVFLLARTADNPALHKRFFSEWTDMHDVTHRYLGVITPAPGVLRLDEWSAFRNEDSAVIKDLECLGDSKPLNTPAWKARATLGMDTQPGPDPIALTPALVGDVHGYQRALTDAASEMRRFFGISEALLPCAVVVCLLERRAFVAALDDTTSLYPLLKNTRIKLEPATTEIDRVDAELRAAKADRLAHRTQGDVEALRWKFDAIRWEWREQLTRLAEDLVEIAANPADDHAERCFRVASRLGGGEPWTADELASARALARSLSAAGSYGRLGRRLRRAIAKLASGHPDTHDVALRLTAAVDAETAIQRRIGQLKAKVDDLSQELHLGAAVVAAANGLGLESVGSRGLLAWRELAWPIEVLAAADPAAPRSASATVTNQAGFTGGHVIQAGTIHGDVHLHQRD